MSDTRIQLIIEAVDKVDDAFNGLKRHLKDSQVETERLNAKSTDLTSSIGRLVASFVSLASALAAVKSGISYLSRIETATLGIASAFMTGGKYIDETSRKALAAEDALKAAQGDARQIIEELQYANLQTIATLDELVNAYQVTLPVALAKGFDRQQVKEFTVAMVQAAGAIGLQMNQLGEETRSLLTAAIDPRNSRIATVLGIRNEDINQFKGDAEGLFNFLMDKLAAYRVAGVEAQNTWAGLWSNFKDILSQSLGKGIEPLFDALKAELKSLADSIVVIDDKAKKIRWNPEFLEGVERFREGLRDCIAEVYRLGMLLDKMGGSFAALMHNVTLADLTGSDRWAKMNDEYRTRYMATEKALQDMAMRSMGWKPMTAEMDKRIREAVLEGKKIAEQTQILVGGEEPGTKQLLRYYRESGSRKGTGWESNPAKPDVDKGAEKANRAAELEALKESNRARIEEMERQAKAEEALMKFHGSTALAIEEKNWSSRINVAWEKYYSELVEIEKEADNKAKEHKGFDREKFVSEKSEAAGKKFEADYGPLLEERKLLDLKAAEQRRLMASAEIQWDRKVAQETILQARTKEGEITAISAEAWQKRQEFHRLTGQETQETDAEIIQSLVDQYKTTYVGGVKAALLEVQDAAEDVGRQMQEATKNAFSSMTDTLAEFVVTGKANFTDLVNSILKDIARIVIRQTITAPLASFLQSGLSALFPAHHEGGLVGATPPSSWRIVPAGIMAGAPRFHEGLLPDEYPAILQKGEIVLRKGTPVVSGSGDVSVRIINESGQKMQIKNSEASFNGQEMIVTVWLDAFQRNAFGLRSALGG